MRKIILFNPSISSLNLGDEIIFRSIYNELKEFFHEDFIVNISTHLPISNRYMRYISDADYKIVCGTNLLQSKMNGRFRQWDIRWTNIKYIRPVILLGVGWWQYQARPNLYTKFLYKRLLATDFLHSVRDSYTENKLKDIGFKNVINTGCPSMWPLTPNHCKDIPTKKANKVILTFTDYNTDINSDTMLFNILYKNYKEVYVWLQGYNDFSYIKSLSLENKVKIIPPSVDALDEKLLDEDIEYVGTRLHAGIRALQKKKRAIIIGIDNRALEKKKDFNIPVIDRANLKELGNVLYSELKTDIHLPIEKIKQWKEQFK